MILPARSLEEAIEVASPGEEYEWLQAHPCLCGGDWRLQVQRLVRSEQNERGSRMTDQLDVRCTQCRRTGRFFFVVQYEGGNCGEADEPGNLAD